MPQREAGHAFVTRQSIEKAAEVKPLPAGGRPKPNLPKKFPRAKVVYSYTAADTDEISISENEVIEVLFEG